MAIIINKTVFIEKLIMELTLCSPQTGLNVTECFRMLMERVEEVNPRKFQDSKILDDDKNNTKTNKGCRNQ